MAAARLVRLEKKKRATKENADSSHGSEALKAIPRCAFPTARSRVVNGSAKKLTKIEAESKRIAIVLSAARLLIVWP